MTIDALNAYGADISQGLGRCMNNESFYLRMVEMALRDKNFDALKAAIDSGDAHAGFEAAHALKGSIGNVALTPIFEPVSKLCEILRGEDVLAEGSVELLDQVMSRREEALAL